MNTIITLETDQLIMSDIYELWNMFNPSINIHPFLDSTCNELHSNCNCFRDNEKLSNNANELSWLVAAAENYQPWLSSRAKEFRKNMSFDNILNNCNSFNDNSSIDDQYNNTYQQCHNNLLTFCAEQ